MNALAVVADKDEADTGLIGPNVRLSPIQERLGQVHRAAMNELENMIVGMPEVLTLALVGAYTSNHVLLQGAPGLAKTKLAKNLAIVLGLQFSRQQFTTDVQPADITGALMLPPGSSEFVFRPGPIFTNVFMADEINRTPPKTQAALLEAMEEKQVTIDGVSRALPNPFFTIATQNEIGSAGTYSLPYAQLDRFGMKIEMPTPTLEDLEEIIRRTTSGDPYKLKAVVDPVEAEDLMQEFRAAILDVVVPANLATAIAKGVLGLSPRSELALPEVEDCFEEGPLVRGMQSLTITAKAFALLDGRLTVESEDIERAAYPVLNHRITLKMKPGRSKVDVRDLIEESFQKALSDI